MNKHNFKAINFHVKWNPLKPVDNGLEIAFPQGNVIDCHNVAEPWCVALFRFYRRNRWEKKAPQLRLDECHLIKGNTSCVREKVFKDI